MPFDALEHEEFRDTEALRRARSLLADRGHWVQGRYKDGDSYCLVGALLSACGKNPLERLEGTALRVARDLARDVPSKSLWQRLPIRSTRWQLINFNDSVRTNHADVVALLDRAIERSMAVEQQRALA